MEVADFFANRSIFITGGTGFMGKVFIEKVLRSCPGVGKIYALVRPGRDGESGQERLNKIHSLPLFDRLKAERPGLLESQLVAVEGDVRKERLGLAAADRQLLISEVSVVYHVAATVRFDQPLQEAVLTNVRGTREVCALVLDMRAEHDPETILVHVSTAYAHSDRKVIAERLYPPHADWRGSVQVAESLDRESIQVLAGKYMEGFPNTYTFTKSMAEHVVNDLCGRGGRTVIVRPSVVGSAYQEPVPGWVDNLNGPVGILSAISSGVVRIAYMNEETNINFVPVDTAIKLMALAARAQFLDRRNGAADLTRAKVYNCCLRTAPVKSVFDVGRSLIWKLQLDDAIWFPSFSLTTNWSWFYVNFLLFQLLPAVLIDSGLSLIGKSKRSLVKIQRKIYVATKSLNYFSLNEWEFKIESAMKLERHLSEADAKVWGYDLDDFDWAKYFHISCEGVKKYVMKETIADEQVYRKKQLVFYYLDYFVKTLFFGTLLSFFYTRTTLSTFLPIK